MTSSTDAGWHLYILRQASGALYTGITTDVKRRVAEHQAMGSKTARSLRGKGPLELVFSTQLTSHSQALQLEYKVKQLSRSKKIALLKGQFQLKDLL